MRRFVLLFYFTTISEYKWSRVSDECCFRLTGSCSDLWVYEVLHALRSWGSEWVFVDASLHNPVIAFTLRNNLFLPLLSLSSDTFWSRGRKSAYAYSSLVTWFKDLTSGAETCCCHSLGTQSSRLIWRLRIPSLFVSLLLHTLVSHWRDQKWIAPACVHVYEYLLSFLFSSESPRDDDYDDDVYAEDRLCVCVGLWYKRHWCSRHVSAITLSFLFQETDAERSCNWISQSLVNSGKTFHFPSHSYYQNKKSFSVVTEILQTSRTTSACAMCKRIVKKTKTT